MYYVWTINGKNKLRVAGSENFKDAMHYALQYTDEGEVHIKKGNAILVRIPKT